MTTGLHIQPIPAYSSYPKGPLLGTHKRLKVTHTHPFNGPLGDLYSAIITNVSNALSG